jgi:hypothetical protein
MLKLARVVVTVGVLVLATRRASIAHGSGTGAMASDPRIVATQTMPQLREIGANYFEALKQSQVWMNIEPASVRAGPAPVRLNVTVAFAGRRLNQPPSVVQVRAEFMCAAFPLRIRQPILRFVIADSATLDLTADRSKYQFVPHCSGRGPLDTIIAELPFDTWRRMAAAEDVTADALGFSVRFTSADFAAWRTFVQTIEAGVIVQPR